MWTFASFLLPFQNTIRWVICKDNQCISHDFIDWEMQYQNSSVLGGSHTGQAKRGSRDQDTEFLSPYNNIFREQAVIHS